MTTLEYIQRVLSAIDSENVTEIDETVEAEQVKLILDSEYERLINRFSWSCKKAIGNLDVTSTPHIMELPDNVQQVEWIKYHKKDTTYLDPKKFVDLLDDRDVGEDNIDDNGCYTDRDPTYWSILNDRYVEFDSYDQSLISLYTKCQYYITPPKLLTETSIPELPNILHQALLDACMERAFRELKGDEQSASVYYKKYLYSIIQAQRWADVTFEENTTFMADSYARRKV